MAVHVAGDGVIDCACHGGDEYSWQHIALSYGGDAHRRLLQHVTEQSGHSCVREMDQGCALDIKSRVPARAASPNRPATTGNAKAAPQSNRGQPRARHRQMDQGCASAMRVNSVQGLARASPSTASLRIGPRALPTNEQPQQRRVAPWVHFFSRVVIGSERVGRITVSCASKRMKL